MDNNTIVSVIIPTYNHAIFLHAAIESVINQTYGSKEIIIIDDGSTDNTKQLLEKFIPSINYVYQQNKGLSAARNTGIKIAKGEFIAFLDADDMWLPNKLLLQYKTIIENQTIGLIGSGYYLIDSKLNITDTVYALPPKNNKLLFDNLLFKNIIYGSGSGVLVRKECFEKVGYFDETLCCAEDWDMWLRIAKYYEVKFIEQPLVKIMVRQNSMSGTTNADKMLKNELRVLDKLFESNDVKFNWYIKNRSYCYRYFRAAWAYFECNNLVQAKKLILRSAFTNPFYFLFNKDCLGLFLRIFFGNNVFTLISRIFKKLNTSND